MADENDKKPRNNLYLYLSVIFVALMPILFSVFLVCGVVYGTNSTYTRTLIIITVLSILPFITGLIVLGYAYPGRVISIHSWVGRHKLTILLIIIPSILIAVSKISVHLDKIK